MNEKMVFNFLLSTHYIILDMSLSRYQLRWCWQKYSKIKCRKHKNSQNWV